GDMGNQPKHVIPQPPSGETAYHGLVGGSYYIPLAYRGKTERYPIVEGTCGNDLNAPNVDPHEEYDHVTKQLFGTEKEPPEGTEAEMLGFLQDFSRLWETWDQAFQILQTYTPQQLPVLNGLSKSYAISDLWFSSVPTQTNPNRAFFTCGTSEGREKNSNLQAVEKFDSPTIWNALAGKQVDWAIFYHDLWREGKCYTWYTFPQLDNIPGAAGRIHNIEDFYGMAAKGTLPPFSFLEPRWGWGLSQDLQAPKIYQQGNDYHPPNNLGPGENFVKRVYDSLTSNLDAWEKTLFVITFDEHGGTWDHISPPWHATPPDGKVGETGFRFNRFGVRVPTILVSPWVEEGTVFRSGNAASPYDHTSLTATILKWAGVDPKTSGLGSRVAVAPTFEGVLSRTTPRKDRPDISPPPPDSNLPLTVRNNTAVQVCVYLGYGPTIPKLYVLGWGPAYLKPGEVAMYDTSLLKFPPCDYYFAASYYVGTPSLIPTDLVDGISGLGRWRLFWSKEADHGWRLALHHQALTITQPAPQANIADSDTGITVSNNTPSKIRAYLGWGTLEHKPYVLGWGPKDIEPGGRATYDPSGDWLSHDYFVSASYRTGPLQDTSDDMDGNLFDAGNWRLLWRGWRAIGHRQTLTISQPTPDAEITFQ
ncbi:MAG: hypothetical protein OK436_06065, partial [Thaumarchaeota archaeon]|nr:hypothetical protein [Nitrososphaerota archaeon]